MNELLKKIGVLQKTPHCSNCGIVHPDITEYSDIDHEGHTACCNEKVCNNLEEFNFGNSETSVRACCWAVAELKFRLQGVDYLLLGEIRRFE